jgi:hypothetical protein
MRLPTFLICGAQRSGTTYLWTLLRSHPDIYLPAPWWPEPKFFAVPHLFAQGLPAYAEHFKEAGDALAIGEKSVTYLDAPEAPERIARSLPDVKLIFLLRDPVERAYSHYHYSVAHCLESLPFVEALVWEPYRALHGPEILRIARPWAYVARGHYAHHLARFYALFDPARILVLYFEEFFADLSAGAATLCQFLGVRPWSGPFPAKVNGRDDPTPMGNAERAFLRHAFAREPPALNRLTGRLVPASWTAPWRDEP